MSAYRNQDEAANGRPGPGGTSGGTMEFLIGLAMLVGGGYLFLDSVQVTTNFAGMWGGGRGTFGLSLIPVLAGIGMLFFDGRSKIGWLIAAGGLLVILVGVISRLDVYFTRRSLFDTLMMLGLIAGGIGLVARSLRSH